ncbi:MAG: hypothetical protein AAGA21_03420 [Pseudomonadota bacterium]
MPYSPDDAILVGPARSGTTLACGLLNKLPDVVALDEPFERERLQKIPGPDAFLTIVDNQFKSQRSMIETKGEADSTLSENGYLANHYATKGDTTTLRKRQVALNKMRDVNAASDFKLIIKHTLPFTAQLKELARRYETFVLVRNPLAILASWNSIDAAYREGMIQPYVEPLADGDLMKRLKAITDRLERQVDLLEWHFEQYRPALRNAKVIRYEDMVETGGRALKVVSTSAGDLNEDLKSHNTNPLYDRELIWELKEKLIARRGAFWDFYAPKQVDELFESMAKQPLS